MMVAEKKAEEEEEEYNWGAKMEIRVLSNVKEEGKLSFIIKDSTPACANTLRRIMIEEVPTMAIEEIEFRKNINTI